jgi:DNA-binding NtrC family response regulator
MYHRHITSIEPDALLMLLEHRWPGNVRELENVFQRATIHATGTSIRADDLLLDVQPQHVISSPEIFSPEGSFEQRIRDYKIKLAESAIQENMGNKSQAARSLQISRAYLHRLLRLAEEGDVAEVE